MNHKEKVSPHVYTVELRFSGDQLEPSEISARLNLSSSREFSPLQNRSRRMRRHPFWAYDGRGEAGFQDEWDSLEDGLQFLLKQLNSRKTDIVALARQFDGYWWCGHFQASFSGGPTLSAKLLAELASYEIPISIDNYFSDKE